MEKSVGFFFTYTGDKIALINIDISMLILQRFVKAVGLYLLHKESQTHKSPASLTISFRSELRPVR